MRKALYSIIKDVHRKKEKEELVDGEISYSLFSSRNSDLLFVFIKNADHPSCVVKICWKEKMIKQMNNGYDNLTKILKLKSDILNGTIPEQLYSGVVNKHQVIVEQAVSGIPLNEYICAVRKSKNKTEDIFYMITNWLIELQKKAGPEECEIEEFVKSENVSETVNLYKKTQPFSAEEEDSINSIFSEVLPMDDCRVPLVMQHGDFSSWNMLYEKKTGKIHVLDWEYSKFAGIPLLDLLNFIVAYETVVNSYKNIKERKMRYNSFSANVYNPRPEPGDFTRIFYKDNWRASLAKKYIKKYCDEIGLNKKLLKPIFLIFIMKHLFYEKKFLAIILEEGLPPFDKI